MNKPVDRRDAKTGERGCRPTLQVACLVAATLVSSLPVESSADLSEPWSVSDAAPVFTRETGEGRQRHEGDGFDSTGGIFCYAWLRFYQVYLPAVTRSTCPMYPSCSQFSIAAVRKHGPFRGIMMTADRLMHEGAETRISPMVQVNGRYLCFDPVESNDFWWEEK